MHVIEVRNAELIESITKQAAERGITYAAIVALIGAIDSFTVSTNPVDDPTAVWPEGHARVRIARLDITGLAFDRERDGDVLVFDPTRVPDGVELTADPILHARSGAYRVSVERRTAAQE